MTDTDTQPIPRQEYTLTAPIVQAGIECPAGATVLLRPDQAERLAAAGCIDLPAKPAKKGG